MPTYSLEGDTSGLPKTWRGAIPYEIEALTPRDVYGHGHSSTVVTCRQLWGDVPEWIRYMVGEVKVVPQSANNLTPVFRRYLPEPLSYNLGDFGPGAGEGTDTRVQWCTGLSQSEQGGNPNTNPDGRFSQSSSNWPETAWCKYQATFETPPYQIRTEDEMADMVAAAGAYAGVRELYRYVVRKKRVYSREQPIPAASTAGGFKIISTVAANRLPIGQVGFRVIQMADISYTWVRIPVGWPPPVGWLLPTFTSKWPPVVNPIISNVAAIRRRDSLVGTINDDYFDMADPEGYAFAPGELLYTGYDDSYKYFDAAGDRVMDVTYTFKFKEGGWNKFLSALGEWKEVSLDGTAMGTKPYSTGSFDQLFSHVA